MVRNVPKLETCLKKVTLSRTNCWSFWKRKISNPTSSSPVCVFHIVTLGHVLEAFGSAQPPWVSSNAEAGVLSSIHNYIDFRMSYPMLNKSISVGLCVLACISQFSSLSFGSKRTLISGFHFFPPLASRDWVSSAEFATSWAKATANDMRPKTNTSCCIAVGFSEKIYVHSSAASACFWEDVLQVDTLHIHGRIDARSTNWRLVI